MKSHVVCEGYTGDYLPTPTPDCSSALSCQSIWHGRIVATAVPEGVFTLPVLSTAWSWAPFQHLQGASFDADSNNPVPLWS